MQVNFKSNFNKKVILCYSNGEHNQEHNQNTLAKQNRKLEQEKRFVIW